jgi:hypothetical protein
MAKEIIPKIMYFFWLEGLLERLEQGEPLPKTPQGDITTVAIAWANDDAMHAAESRNA